MRPYSSSLGSSPPVSPWPILTRRRCMMETELYISTWWRINPQDRERDTQREKEIETSLHISFTSTMRCSVARTQQTKKTLVPTVPSTRTRTRTQMGELDWGEVGGSVRRSELFVGEKPVCHLLRLHSLSRYLLRIVARYARIWVCKWGPHKFLGILSILRVSEGKIKHTWVFTQDHEYYVPILEFSVSTNASLYLNSTHHKRSCTQLKYLSIHGWFKTVLLHFRKIICVMLCMIVCRHHS